MENRDALICAYRFDDAGGATTLSWDDLAKPGVDGGFTWIHLITDAAGTLRWFRDESGLDRLLIDALLARDTRPRYTAIDHTAIVNLRGVNLNPNADPEDMVALRMCIEKNRVITCQRRNLKAIADVRAAIEANHGPKSPGDLVVMIAENLAERMEPVITSLDESIDTIEDAITEDQLEGDMSDLVDVRRKAVILRRYIGPQRDALVRLANDDEHLLTARNKHRLREAADDVTRYVESLNAVWERAAVVKDEWASRQAEQANQSLYVLSVIAALFLPPTFVTGLLGINVGGIPGADSTIGFVAVSVVLVGLAIVEIVIFRRLRWL